MATKPTCYCSVAELDRYCRLNNKAIRAHCGGGTFYFKPNEEYAVGQR